MEKEYRGTPISSNIKLHNKIGNIETNPILISKRLFENADEFFFTARIILQNKPTYLSSVFTNLSFACELYFKSIIFESKKNGTAIKEHKLDKLFKLLPSEKQNEIKDNFQFLYEKIMILMYSYRKSLIHLFLPDICTKEKEPASH